MSHVYFKNELVKNLTRTTTTTKKCKAQMASLVHSTKYLRKKQYQFHTNFQEIQEKGGLHNSFYIRLVLSLYQRQTKTLQKKKEMTDQYFS